MVFLVLAFDTATIIPLEAFAIFYTTVYSILPSLAGGLSLSISQIAEACGFSDYNYFIAVFSRLTQQHEIISTADVRACVIELLREKGLFQTADCYADFSK